MRVSLRIVGSKEGEEAKKDFGASCYLLVIEIGGLIFVYLIDIGLETADDEVVTWRGPRDLGCLEEFPKIDGIFLTHAHRDHAAGLCLKAVRNALKDGAKIVLTRTTAQFLPWVLFDQRKVSIRRGEDKPYGAHAIWQMTRPSRMCVVMRPEVIELVPGAISVFVLPSGHIRGACSFIFMIREGKKVLRVMFSGDYAVHDQLSTFGAPLPPEEWFPDIIASFDCTNGGEQIRPWQEEARRMGEDGLATIKGGEWFLPWAFSMDRSQTVAKSLYDLGLPVTLAGSSAVEFAGIMQSADGFWCEGDRPISLRGIKTTEILGDALDAEPHAVVAPSGMAHGPVVRFLKEILPRDRALVAACGYQAPGTNGYRILHASRGDSVILEDEKGLVEIPVRARCEQYRMSGHSSREQAVARITRLLSKSIMRTPTVVLCHGSQRAFDWFGKNLIGYRVLRADRREHRHTVLEE